MKFFVEFDLAGVDGRCVPSNVLEVNNPSWKCCEESVFVPGSQIRLSKDLNMRLTRWSPNGLL